MQNKTYETPEPERETTESALSRCLVEGDAVTKSCDRRRRREALGISFAIESVVLALLIVLPLMTSVAQPHLNSTLNTPIAFGQSRAPSEPQRPPSAIHRFEKLRAHSFTFAMKPTTQRPAAHPEEEADSSTFGPDSLGGMYSSEEVSIVGLLQTDASAHPRTEIKKTEEKRVVRVSEPMQQAQLITRIVPRYPPLAVQTRTEGTVLLHAIISLDGRITALDVVSGQPLLVRAAVDAVRQWRYRPTYLNGEPVEVETSITVIFRLSQ